MMLRAAIACALVLVLAPTAQAHGGGLHRWTLDPAVLTEFPAAPIRPYFPTLVAVARNFSVLNTTAVLPTYILPFSPSYKDVAVKGYVNVYSYLSNNCTNAPQATLCPSLMFSRQKKVNGKMQWTPYGYLDKETFGYGFTGNCSAPGNLYRNNITMQDDRFNLAFWHDDNLIGEGLNATTLGKPGYLWGGAPNSYQFRGPWQAALGAPLGCIIVVVQGAATYCSNVEWLANPDSIMAGGNNCSVAG